MLTFFQYIRFFVYISYHWNIWLAFFMLYHDIRGALRYGIRKTFVPVQLRHLTINSDISKSSPYEAVNYYMLEKLLGTFQQNFAAASILDLGCGKGRVMATAAYFGFRNIKGIDFAKELCEEAIFNMQKTQSVFPDIKWEVICSDVLDYSIQPEDAVFFMFNPFVKETIDLFLDKLDISCRQFPRVTYFLYASPQHADALEKRGYKIVYRHTLMSLKGFIFCKE